MTQPITVIGLPYQFGRRATETGYQMARGPELLVESGAVPDAIKGWCDDVEVVWLDHLDEPHSSPGEVPKLPPGDQMTRQLAQNNGLASAVRDATARGRFPLVSAGGCNSSIGVVAGLADSELSIFWFDAHADADTPDTSVHGLFEGMPVSTIAGMCWQRYAQGVNGFTTIPEARIAQIGLHDTGFRVPGDPRQGIGSLVGPEEVEQHGFEAAFSRSLDVLSAQSERTYLHFDADVVDPSYMRGNLHTAPGGPSPDQLVWATERVAERMRIEAINFTSWDTAADERAFGVLVPLINEIATIAVASRAR